MRLLSVLAVVYAAYPLAAEARQMWRFHVAQELAFRTNVPPMQIRDWQHIKVLDAMHLTLPDGQVVRLAGLGDDNPYTSRPGRGIRNSIDDALHTDTIQCGIKPVGMNGAGERLVELWALQRHHRIVCGNSSHEERRWAGLKIWKNLGEVAIENGWSQLGGVDSRPIPAPPVRWEDEVSRYLKVAH